jgi:hypothetical protein
MGLIALHPMTWEDLTPDERELLHLLRRLRLH